MYNATTVTKLMSKIYTLYYGIKSRPKNLKNVM